MKFEHLISAFLAEPWAIQREKLGVLADVLVARAEGEKLFSSEFAASIDDARAKEIAETGGSVAIIPVYGVLAQRMDAFSAMSGGTSYAGIKRALHSALSNSDIKAVVLDIDSPAIVSATRPRAVTPRRCCGRLVMHSTRMPIPRPSGSSSGVPKRARLPRSRSARSFSGYSDGCSLRNCRRPRPSCCAPA